MWISGLNDERVCYTILMYLQKSGAKYHSETSQVNGVTYQSKFEAAYAQELDLRVRAREIVSWERQIKCEIVIDGIKICTYWVDFLVHYPNGDKELVETKGFETDLWKIKRKLLEAVWLKEHPEYSYTVVKQSSRADWREAFKNGGWKAKANQKKTIEF